MVKETHVTLSLPKGMKQTEIGLIPEDWQIVTIKDITNHLTNGFVGVAKTHYTEKSNGIIYLQGFNVEENHFNFTGIKKITPEFHLSHLRSSLKHKDLLTVQTGDVGLTTFVPTELEGSNCHALIISRYNKREVESKFVSFYLNSKQGRNRLKDIETGTTMKHINVGEFQHFQISLPPLAEQEAIAAALSDCDAWIESLEAVIAKKRLIKQGAMQELLTPKVDWEVKKLGEVADIIGGGTPSTFVSKYWNGNIEWFTPTEVGYSKYLYSSRRKISYLGFKNASANLLPKNSILLTSRAGIGDLGILKIEACTNQGFQSIVCKENIDFEFIYYLMSTKKDFLLKNASGSTFLEISPNKVKSLEIQIPSLSEQTRIATVLSDMDAELEALGQKLNKARQIKQGMMQELLTGRVRLV